MGGSSKSQPVPDKPQPIDYAALMRSANEQAAAAARAQVAAQVEFYPQMEALQLGTIGKLSGNLNNAYTQQAKGVIDTTLQQGASSLADTGNRINQLGALNMGLAADAFRQAQVTTALDQQIASQGASAMNVRADQVSMPDRIRNARALNASAARIAPVDQVASRDVAAAQMDAAPMVEAQYARSRSTGSGALGDQLLSSAQSRLANNGQLSEEELRNASQGARGAFAARGLGVGSGAAAAEILNRSAFSRQRMNEDAAFAANVQAQDLARRQNNTSAANQFALANQGVGMQAQLANQQVGYNTNLQNAQFGQAAQLANQDAALRAALANQGTSLSLGQANAGFAQQSALANQQVGMQAQLANQSRDQAMNQQRMAAQQSNQAANMNQLAANRDFLMNANTAGINSNITRGNYAGSMLGNTANLYGQAGGAYQNAAQLGFGGANALVNLDPYQRALGQGIQLGSGIQGQTGQMIGNAYNSATQMAGNVASFNANMLDSRYNSALNNNAALAGAQSAGNSQLLGAGIGAVGAIGMGAAIF
jgi:hypothetical protein